MIKGNLTKIRISDNHEELEKQARIEIEKGNLKYAKANNDSKNYCINNSDIVKEKKLVKKNTID